MKRFNLFNWGILFLLISLSFACSKEDFSTPNDDLSKRYSPKKEKEIVVVANRVEKSISIINAVTNELIREVSMPHGGEPMYVTYDAKRNRIFVGDRANDRVVAFHGDYYYVTGTAPAGKGVFHMWDSPNDRSLWVVNDIDNTLSEINQYNFHPLKTVPIPADLVAQGGKPHDVIVDPSGKFVYTTVIGFSDNRSYVLKYSTIIPLELARMEVGGDAHLSLTTANDYLYVPCQESDEVFVLNRSDLSEVKRLRVPGAHGVGMTADGSYLYVTNLPARGKKAIYTIDLATNTLVGKPASVDSDGVPHNLAVNMDGSKLFLTHSGGGARRFSAFDLDMTGLPNSSDVSNLDVGLNPFGLVYFKKGSSGWPY